MSIITLTSDFGYTDPRVAAIKGNLLSLDSNFTISDISHNLQPHNLLQASYIIRNAYHHFPKNTIHIISIDSLYHPSRRFLVYRVNDHTFIVPDNGLMSLVFHDIKPQSVYEITINHRFDDVVRCTTIDIFLPVAHHLAKGGIPEVIGRKINDPKELILPKAQYLTNEKMLAGEVIYIDHFGNVVSNITQEFFQKHKAGFENFKIKFRNLSIERLHQHYTDIIDDYSKEQKFHGREIALFNNAGYLEIAIYKGSISNGAKTLFGLDIGEKIYVEFSK